MSQSTFTAPERAITPESRPVPVVDAPRAPVPLPVRGPVVSEPDSAPTTVRRKVGDKRVVGEGEQRTEITTNVVFGLNGRSAEQIATAIVQGYRTFDGADTYGDTIELLAAEIARAITATPGLTRDDFDIVYKVLDTAPDAVAQHVGEVAGLFGGRVDHLLIHQTTDAPRAGAYLPHLVELRRIGAARHIGAGDVAAGNIADFADLDCFEVSAAALLFADGAEELAAELTRIGKPVLVYNLMHAVRELYDGPERAGLTAEHLAALLGMLKQRVPTVEPIVSSADTARSEQNLTINDPDRDDDFDVLGDVYARVGRRQAELAGATEIGAMPGDVKGRVVQLLSRHSDGDWYDSAAGIAEELPTALATFTDPELDVVYRSGEGAKGAHSLRTWITMLHATQNCDVAPAHGCLTSVLWS